MKDQSGNVGKRLRSIGSAGLAAHWLFIQIPGLGETVLTAVKRAAGRGNKGKGAGLLKAPVEIAAHGDAEKSHGSFDSGQRDRITVFRVDQRSGNTFCWSRSGMTVTGRGVAFPVRLDRFKRSRGNFCTGKVERLRFDRQIRRKLSFQLLNDLGGGPGAVSAAGLADIIKVIHKL